MEVAEQWRRQFSLGEPGENVTGSMAVLRARAPGARLSIVRTEWRSTGRTTATGTTSSTRTIRGAMRGSTTMTNNREPEKLSSPSLVSRKPLEISTTRLESDDDSSVEQKYQVSEPSDTETSEPTGWTRPISQPTDNSSSNLSTGYSRNNDLFNDIDNFIIKPSQLRKCSTISEESLNEVRNRIKSLVSNGSQSNTSDTSESRFRDDGLKVSSPVSRVKTFISKMESNAEGKHETNSIGSRSSMRSMQSSYDGDAFENSYSDRSSDKVPSFRSKPFDFSSESDFSLCDQISEKSYKLKLIKKTPIENNETFQDWLSKNNKPTASSFQLPKNKSEPVNKWDLSMREKSEDFGVDPKSTGKISISIPVTHESGFGTARKKVIQHSVCEGTTVSIESSKPHSIITNASNIFPQDARHIAIRNYTTKDDWRDSNSPMSSSLSKTETKQVYNEEFDENNEKKNKRVEFCKTEVHFAMESGQMKIVETDDKPPPTNNFRRRRKGSTFVPLAPVDRKIPPVTLFGAATDLTESHPFANLGEDTTRSEKETQYSMENSGQLYREEENHTVTSVYEHDVVPRGILKNKPIKPLPYHLGADYEFGSINRDDSVWGVKLKPVSDKLSASSGIALSNKKLRQSVNFPNQNYENNNILNANNGVNISNERIIKVKNERLQSSGLSVYEHLEKLKQSEKNKVYSSDTESELSGIPEKESVAVTQPRNNVLSPLHAPVSKSPELKTAAPLAPMSPTKSRKLRANELTYFGIQPSPEPEKKEIKELYSEINIDNKPDIIEHTFVNHKTAPTSKFNKTQRTKEPAERRSKNILSDQPIYINISAKRKFTPVAAPRSNSTKPEVGIEELNLAAGEISKIADQYSNEGSPWDSSINNDFPLETINETRGHRKETKTTERKSNRIVKSTSDKTRPSPDKSNCIDIGSTVQRAAEKKLPVVKSHKPHQSSTLEPSVVAIETVIVPPARKKRTQTNESKTDSQARSDSRGKHRETKLNSATKQRSHCVIPVTLESNVENPSRKPESNKGNTIRREHLSKDRKETTLEKRRTGDQPKVTRPSEIDESRPRELRGKQLRTPTPSSQLRSSSADNRTSSRQRDDRQMKYGHENQEPSSKRTHQSRIISHPVKDGMISPSRSKRDTSSRDRSGKNDSGRVRERKEEYENREKERKKGISSRQSPGKTVEKKKRLKVTLEIKNPLGPLIKQKNGAK